MSRTPQRLALLVVALLAPASGARSSEATPTAADGGGAVGPAYRVIAGRVARVDREKARVEIDEGGRPVEISYDRNTSVFLERHLGTVRDVRSGVEVRASIDGGGLASWIEVRGPPPSHAPPPR